uniref:Uncharacterized protein n=1 Tax=Panagrolaimus sp. ES5 TaxID=591445 RepID=A0AC34GFD4_9BILA
MYMQGTDLQVADYDKRTALHLAACEGHADIIRFLLNTAKVRADPKDRWNRTPLQDAKAEGHIACIKLLEQSMQLSEGHEDEDDDNQAPAKTEIQPKQVKKVEKPKKYSIADYDKRTALHLAACEGHADIIRFLLNTAKVRADPKDRWNRTPLQDAKAEGHIACIKLLEQSMQLSEGHEDEDDDNQAPAKTEVQPKQVKKVEKPKKYSSPQRQSSTAATIRSTESSSSDTEEEEEDFRILLETKKKEIAAYEKSKNPLEGLTNGI